MDEVYIKLLNARFLPGRKQLIMDFKIKERKRGKDKEMDRRKRNGGKSTKHVRITEAMNENKSKKPPKKHKKKKSKKFR